MLSATCEMRIDAHLQQKVGDLRRLFQLYQEGSEEGDPDLGTFPEYGLSFDYVPARTFRDQENGYFRYQLSWGGPQEELRFLTEDPDNPTPPIEFWFLDWFDGASRPLVGQDRDLLLEIWRFFQESGWARSTFKVNCCGLDM